MKKITFYLLMVFGFSLQLGAQAFVEWTGTGNNWSNNSNWTIPYAYGQLEFKGNGNATSNNDLTSAGQYRFYFNGATAYTLTGNKVQFTDFGGNSSWLLSDSSVDQTIDLDVEFADAGARPGWITTRAAGSFIFNNISAINSVTQIQFANTTGGTKTIVNGTVSGAKDIYIGRDDVFAEQAETWVEFNGPNTYTGNTFIDAGRIDANNPTAMGVDADIFIANNGLFRVKNATTIASVQERGTGNGGNVNILSGGTLTINGANKGDLFQRKIIGQGDLVLNTTGTTKLILYTQSNLNGTVTIKNDAKLRLSGDMVNADIIVENGGFLEIEGSNVDIKSLTVNMGGNVILNDNKKLTVIEDIINEGTITLSTSNNGDLHVQGNFVQDGTLINNDRAVFFEGTANQAVSGLTAPINFDYLRVDKSAGILTFNENIEVNQSAGGTGYEQTLGDVNVAAGKYLRVNNTGVFIINGGDFTLNSTNLTYSSLIADAVTGDINYKRHVNNAAGTGTSTTANDLVSPPVSGMTFGDLRTVNSNILSGTIGGNGPFYLFGPFDNSSVNNYVLYEETVDDAIVLNTGVGYRTGSTDGSTYTFTGTVETGNIPEAITVPTGGSRWNLIGNPYPSYISLSEFLSVNNGQFDTSSAGVYGYDGAATDGWVIWNNITLFSNPTAVISPGQGFFVASKSGGGTVNFNANMRSIGNSDDFIPMRSSAAVTNIKLGIATAMSNFDTDIYFTEFTTLGLDPGYDASLFGGNAPAFSIYSHLVQDNNGIPFAIQALGETDYNMATIALGVNATQGEQLTFSLMANSLPSTVEVYLEDNVANTNTLLNNGDYVLTPNADLGGTGRFFLNFSNPLSTPENSLSNLKIYTNDADKTIVIKGQLTEDTAANVYDIQGRLVIKTLLSATNNSQSIDISKLSSGAYIVRLHNNTQTKTQKVIIQ